MGRTEEVQRAVKFANVMNVLPLAPNPLFFHLVSRPRCEEGTGMSGSASAAARHAAVRAVVLSRAVAGGRGGFVDGRGRRLGRPRDALHHVVVRSKFHLEQTTRIL